MLEYPTLDITKCLDPPFKKFKPIKSKTVEVIETRNTEVLQIFKAIMLVRHVDRSIREKSIRASSNMQIVATISTIYTGAFLLALLIRSRTIALLSIANSLQMINVDPQFPRSDNIVGCIIDARGNLIQRQAGSMAASASLLSYSTFAHPAYLNVVRLSPLTFTTAALG